MFRRMASFTVIVIAWLAVCSLPAGAQQRLGDFVANGGYDWVIGKWVVSSDNGKIELEYRWALDRYVVLAELRTVDYRYSGIIMLDPDRGEVVEAGADDKGGTVKGDWTDEGGDLVYRLQHTDSDGNVKKIHIVYAKVDADTITIAMYGVDNSGYRNSEPMSKLTYKRQPATAATDALSSGQMGRTGYYQNLGDLVSQVGYEWMAGKWLATDNERKCELEHKWGLNKHVVLMDLKMGDFVYHGMIMYNPAWQEIFQVGADNMGGIWKGTWDQSYEGVTHRVEYIRPDGAIRRMEHVYVRDSNDAFQVKEYPVTAGSRASQPSRTLAFARQKTAGESK